MTRQIHFGLFILGTGSHVAGWRYPAAFDSFQKMDQVRDIARIAERGLFDLIFMGDNLYADPGAHPSYTVRLEPLTMLAALAGTTTRIGLGATVATTYSDPFTTARAFACQNVPLRQRPRLLSDNGPGFISDAFAQWLAQHGIQHVRGAPAHPQTQGKIERWHQTMKNRILLENYYLPGALEAEIAEFVEQYNHRRYHESLNNLNPADVYFGRGQTILLERERIKRRTIQQRRLMHHQRAA